MEEAARLCDRLLIMDDGRIVTEGEPGALVREHVGREVLELKLGEAATPRRCWPRSMGAWTATSSPRTP